jgi:Protein of unknown function (DUF3999)
MSRRFLCAVLPLAGAALGVSLLAADLHEAWRSWRYTRAIEHALGGALNYVTLDRAAFSHSEGQLSDLRVIDDTGKEIPYEVRSQITRPPEPVKLPSNVRENSFVPKEYTQVVVDLGGKTGFHNNLRVRTPETDFINWVEVAASDDAHVWRIVNARAPISRFNKENLEGNQTVRYSENNARYLRVRIQETQHPFQVTDIEVFSSPAANRVAAAENGISLANSLAPDANGSDSLTRWTVDLGSGNIPISRFAFETSQPEFYRAVRILTSSDGKEWQFAGGGEIHRYVFNGVSQESLDVPCNENWGSHHWRAEVLNGNDAPLSDVRLSVLMPQRFVLFHGAAGRSYRMLYGNSRVTVPDYDLVRTLQIPGVEAMGHPSLGTEEVTSNYVDPSPFTERHPNLLWAALGLAVILLGYAAVRALRAPASTGEAN